MPTVYLPHEPPPLLRTGGGYVPRDLSSAARYGKLVTILGSKESPSLTPGPCTIKLAKALREFQPDEDYVCFAGGDPLSLALAMTALLDLNVREVQFLRWERQRDTSGQRTVGGFYVPIKVRLHV